MSITNNMRAHRRIEAVYRLGPRVIAELLEEVADPMDLDIALSRYARLDRDTVKALGGDRFPEAPLRKVG